MSGEDEQFCRCTTLWKAMTFVIIITILEMIFHLGFCWPVTKMVFEDNLVLYLGMMIPLTLLTVIRTILIIYAMMNKLDFFAREKNYFFYVVSTLVEWAILTVWVVKFYKTKFDECTVIDPVCTWNSGIMNFAFLCYLYGYVVIAVPSKLLFSYIQFRFYMA